MTQPKSKTTIPKDYSDAFKQGWNAALAEAAEEFEHHHNDGPLGKFDGNWVSKVLKEMME